MGRRPGEQPSRDARVLAERLRALRDRSDLAPADRLRLEKILREMGNLDGIGLEDILGPLRPGGPNVDAGQILGDFNGVRIKPAQLSGLIGQAATDVPRGVDGLDFVVASVLGRLRKELPAALPTAPVRSGRKGAELPVSSEALGTLVRLAALRRTEGDDRVVWDDGTNQLVVDAAGVRSVVTEGMVRILVPVACDQTRAKMDIVFAVGSGTRAAGMIAATADRPMGDALVAAVWGDALIAFAYGILLDLADSLAGASGRDEKNDRLVPRGLVARRGQLNIETQARFSYDRSVK